MNVPYKLPCNKAISKWMVVIWTLTQWTNSGRNIILSYKFVLIFILCVFTFCFGPYFVRSCVLNKTTEQQPRLFLDSYEFRKLLLEYFGNRTVVCWSSIWGMENVFLGKLSPWILLRYEMMPIKGTWCHGSNICCIYLRLESIWRVGEKYVWIFTPHTTSILKASILQSSTFTWALSQKSKPTIA